jgi:Zn-dependent protease
VRGPRLPRAEPQHAAPIGDAGAARLPGGDVRGGRRPLAAGTEFATRPVMYKIGRIAGVDLVVHWSFAVLLGGFVVSRAMGGQAPGEIAVGLVLVLLVFGTVVLHELGHVLVARRYGVRTRSILLLPIGGIARMDSMPSRPSHELLIAVAGPAVNVVIAAGLGVLLVFVSEPYGPWNLDTQHGALLAQLLWINVSLALFNLLPAFPMDGGRVVRALLSVRLEPVRATQLAARLGAAIAALLVLAGLLGNPMLVLIGIFVWFGGRLESEITTRKAELAGFSVGHAMRTDFRALAPDEPVRSASELVLRGIDAPFPVVDCGRVVGILTQDALVAGLAQASAAAPVGAIMLRPAPTIDVSRPLGDTVGTLGPDRPTVVTDRGQVVGVLTAERVAELGERVRLQRALGQ